MLSYISRTASLMRHFEFISLFTIMYQGSSKKTLNRYEKQVQKKKEKITRGKNTHAVSISIEGRKMPL